MSELLDIENSSILRNLKNTYLFNIFSEDELDTILSYCSKEKFPQSSIIFEEGDVPDKFYIITSGKIIVYLSIPYKEKITLYGLNEGDFFGEMSLLDSFPRSATIQTDCDTQLLSMTYDKFNELMAEKKHIGIKWLWTFCRVLSSRLRDAHERYKRMLGGEFGEP